MPAASTVVLQMAVPVGEVPTVTAAPGTPVPLKVGVVSLSTTPVAGELIDEDALLIVNERAVAGLTLPATSVAVAITLCAPLIMPVGASHVQLPLASAVAVQTVVVPSTNVTVLPASAVPLKVGVLSLVVLLAAGLLMTGAAGAVLSMVNARVVDAVPVLPVASVAVAVMLCAPALIALVGVQVQLPLASAVAVQTVVVPSFTTTLLPASALPEKVGVVSLNTLLAVG